jgi:hypothetical protein
VFAGIGEARFADEVAIAGALWQPPARPHQETPGTFAGLLDAFIADLT